MGSPDPGSGRTGRRRQRSGHGACQEMVQLLGQGQRFREVTERWRSLENLCKGRMSERTSEWWQDKHAELPGGVGTGLQGRAGGSRRGGRGPWAPCEGSSRGAAWPGSRATAVPQHRQLGRGRGWKQQRELWQAPAVPQGRECG